MKRLRALLIAVSIIAAGTVSAFADIVSIEREIYRARWYIVVAVVVIIVAIVLLRAAIRRRARKTEETILFDRYENGDALAPVGAAPGGDVAEKDHTSDADPKVNEPQDSDP